QTMDNPVFYVQYAHARIASLLRVADERGVALPEWRSVDLDVLTEPAELDLLRTLSELPETVAAAAESLTPHRLARYTEEVAATCCTTEPSSAAGSPPNAPRTLPSTAAVSSGH